MAGLPVTSVVLDMDGLLINTEPTWRAAEAEVFAALGVELTEAELLAATGQATAELAAIWRQRRPQSARQASELDQLTNAEIEDRVTDLVIGYVIAEREPMAGVREAIAMLRRP